MAFHQNPSTSFARLGRFLPRTYGYNSSGPHTFVHGLLCAFSTGGGHGLQWWPVSRWWCASAFFVPPRPPWSPPSPLVASGGGGGQCLGGGLHLGGHGLGGGGGGTKFFHLHGLHWWRWWWWPRWWHWWRCAFSSASASFVLVSPRSRPSLIYTKGLGQWWRCASVVAFSAALFQCHGLHVWRWWSPRSWSPRWRCASVVMASVASVCLLHVSHMVSSVSTGVLTTYTKKAKEKATASVAFSVVV